MATTHRVGRPGLIANMTANQLAKPARPRPVILREPTADDAQIAKIAKMLNIDDSGDWSRIAAVQRELESRGIETVKDLRAVLDDDDDEHLAHGWTRPSAPRPSLSPLYSDTEIFDFVAIDTDIIDIPSVAITSTTTITLSQKPMKWAFTDITIDGDVAASGSSKLIEARVILGTRVITKFRLSQLARQINTGMVFDALQKIYSYEIGPNSVVKLEIANLNTGVGQVFQNGYFQFAYQPVVDEAAARVLRRGAV